MEKKNTTKLLVCFFVVLLTLGMKVADAQTGISADSGEALPGPNILIPGTSAGTTTDAGKMAVKEKINQETITGQVTDAVSGELLIGVSIVLGQGERCYGCRVVYKSIP